MDALTRAFISIRIPQALQDRLAGVQLDLKRRGGSDAVKWSPKEEMHITLCFLGELRIDQVSNIQRAIDGIGARHPAMELGIQGLSGFPNGTQPRVLVANVIGDLRALLGLQSELEQAAAPHTLHRENRAYSPHVTLGRVRTDSEQARTGMGRALRLVEAPELGRWRATDFELMRSTIGPMGPTYSTIQRYDLGCPSA